LLYILYSIIEEPNIPDTIFANISLLDDISKSNNKPELEIYADDVKCSHGSTISKIDQDHLYYFNSRGISSDLATKILKKAFIQEVLDSIENVSLKQISDKIVSSFL